ncbi:MAG: CBS domain-containing protein [Chloroflexi bacterium]|nr:MAG: CBS domain-containing protein [Chloroflexota bacterium]TME56566.1 MAG: CBS domain-containing protein [Chloroflexota bacterium]
MKVKDVPPGKLLSIDPNMPLAEVAARMRVGGADSAAVMSEGRLVGIVTERDLVRAIADALDPKLTKAALIMTVDPATIGPDEEVAVVALKMMRLGIRHLPVVDSSGEPIGLISAGDLVAVLEGGKS